MFGKMKMIIAAAAFAGVLTASVPVRAEAADPCSSIATLTVASMAMGFFVAPVVGSLALVACHAME